MGRGGPLTMPLAQQQQLMDLAQDVVTQLDMSGYVRSINSRGVALFRAPAADALIGVHWPSLWALDFQQAAINALDAARKGHNSHFVTATTESHESRRWWSVSVGPLIDDGGSVVGLGAVSRDITERVQMEASLEAINDVLREDLASAARTIETGARREATLAQEMAVAERAVLSGDRRNAELHDRLDLSELAQSAAERVAQQAQKGEAIAQMLAGMSPDFNNNLQTVLSALDALISMGDLSSRQNRFAGFALTAARHASVTARRLLEFSGIHVHLPTPSDLNALVNDIVPLLQGTLGRHMRVDFLPASGELPVFADGHSIQQALMNLCLNARDACDGRGTIRIRLGSQGGGQEESSCVSSVPDYVFAEVSDDGPGMSDEVRERLFEPFFTTKAPGKGTGLGMSQVLSMARQADGSVEVQTELGEGTRVRLLFPRINRSTVS